MECLAFHDLTVFPPEHEGGYGTVFKVSSGGSLTILVNFNSTNGEYPQGALIQGTDGNFYGTTLQGGSSNIGTVFKMTPTGTLTTLVNFISTNGAEPYAGLIQGSDGNFYGTTHGLSPNYGTVFQLTRSGTLTTLVNFNGTNGANPYAGVIQASDGNFYGTTEAGGAANAGTVFRYEPTTSENVTFSSSSTIPIIASAYTITGSALTLTLNYAPSPGDVLTVVQNTGGSPISGAFTNLPNGGSITATYQGVTYTFIANYSGGSGENLTLALASNPSDTPTMPPWALVALALLLLSIASKFLPTPNLGKVTSLPVGAASFLK